MKILAIERSGLFYGSAVNLRNWIKEYKENYYYDIDVLLGENGEINSELISAGAKILDMSLPTSLNSYGKININKYKVASKALHLLKYNLACIKKTQKNYDVVVVNNYRSAVYYLPLLIFIRISTKSKLIVRYQISQTPIRILRNLINLISHKIIIHGTDGYCLREFGKNILQNEKVVCIPNPVDTDKFQFSEPMRELVRNELNIPLDAFVFLSICYIEPRKGVLQLVKAFSKINMPNCYLVHIGDQGTHNDYFNEVKDSANKNTIFLGKKNKIERYYSLADTFVLYSEYEGMPYVIVEAMSSGLPVISTFSGSNEEVVTKEVGDIIEYDNIPALINTLNEYIADDIKMCKSKGLAAREKVKRLYSEEQYFRSLREIF